MKFIISSNKFKKVVSLVSHLCGSNLTLPILNNILINLKKDILELSSTNLEIGLSVFIPVEMEKEGKITVPGKIFSDFISSLPDGDVKLEEKDLTMNIKCKGFQAKILGKDSKDFPVLPQIKEEKLTELEASEIVSGFSKVSHVVSSSDARVEISGILMKIEKKNLKLVGTDSIRLSEKKINLPEETKKTLIIIPQKTAVELNYIFSNFPGTISVVVDPSQIAFNLKAKDPLDPKITLVSRLIEGQYPEYEEIIPKETKTRAILDREEFQKKIKIASLFSSRIQDVKLAFRPAKNHPEKNEGSLSISAASSEVGETTSEIKGKIEGNPLEITFNWKYLLDGLSVINSSEVFLGANDPTSPTILKPIGDETYLYVLMPKTI